MLDELERLLKDATPGPWLMLPGYEASEDWRDDDTEQGDIRLTCAAVNALPALLRVARAAQELTRTMEVDETIRVSGAGLYGLAEALAALNEVTP